VELGNNVKKGIVKDIMEVKRVISAAELSIAHEYVIDLNEYVVESKAPDAYYPHFNAAMKAIQNAENYLTGDAKTAAIKLREESASLMDKIDEGLNVTEAEISAQRAKMNKFLSTHKPSAKQ
jgi:hypothetical protein